MNNLTLAKVKHLLRYIPSLYQKATKKQRTPIPNIKDVIVSLSEQEPLTSIDTHYLSFSIDISVLAGGFWWEGSHKTHKGLGALRVPPLNLTSKKLDKLVTALGPAYLRVGGSEADKIDYFDHDDPDNTSNNLILTHTMWDELHEFIQRNHLKFIFTFKYGLFTQQEHGSWQPCEAKKLLDYTQEKNYTIDVCELGNELNAYWAFYGLRSQPLAKKLANDYSNFIHCIREASPETLISGPGSAFWPRLGETIKPFSNITQKVLELLEHDLDIVDWHYYPFQSRRSPIRTRTATIKNTLSPKNLNDYAKYAAQIRSFRDQYQPEAILWTGETGSAQCGGEPNISDRFASCFWWADQLGQGAVVGQKVMVRQSLIGGDYSLVDRLTLKPKPDYWVSWLWGQLMGTLVYHVPNTDNYLRIYCHSAVRQPNQDHNKIHKTLLIINMSSNRVHINFDTDIQVTQKYDITAKELTSKKIRINGIKPKFKKGDVSLKDFPTNVEHRQTKHIQPYSINFWCI